MNIQTALSFAGSCFRATRRCLHIAPKSALMPSVIPEFCQEQWMYTIDNWNPNLYSKESNFVVKDGIHLLNQLQPRPGERILDLGCGTGEVTVALKNAGSTVIGVDSSLSMVEAAKARGVNAYLADSRQLDFYNEFDAVFSNMALHWMPEDPQGVVKNIARSLRKNGRFVAEFMGHGGMNSVLSPMRSILNRHGIPETPYWYQPFPDEFAQLLASEGLLVKHISLVPRKYHFRGGPRTWLELFGSKLLGGVDGLTKQQIYNEVEQVIDPTRTDEEGYFVGDGMVINVSATKAF